MGKLDGKTAIITGASGGIGSAAAKEMLAEGANVVLFSRSKDKLDALAAALGDEARVLVHPGDISKEEDVAGVVAAARAKFGGLHVFFANAGTEGAIKPMFQLTVEEFDEVQSTNVKGVFLSLKHATPAIMESGGGAVVCMASVAGVVGVPGLGAYAASKHAVAGLAKVAALELAENGVRVNAIAAAPIDNQMMRSIEEQAAPGAAEAAREGFTALIPMKRYGRNEEVAKMATFLASDDASFTTGQCITVDGGFTAA